MSLPHGFLDDFYVLCRRYGLDMEAATDELAVYFAFRRASESRAWVRLQSRRRIDLINPSPMDFEPEDLAHGQGITKRWGGNTIHEHPMTDAQHALLVLEIARQEHPTGLAPRVAMGLLVHDGSEGGLGINFDPVKPLKPFLGAPYREVDRRLQGAIHLANGLPVKLPAEWTRLIHTSDRKAAAAEALHIAGWSAEEIRTDLRIPFTPMVEDPLARKYGMTPWVPWDRPTASRLFLEELYRLQRAIAADGQSGGRLSG